MKQTVLLVALLSLSLSLSQVNAGRHAVTKYIGLFNSPGSDRSPSRGRPTGLGRAPDDDIATGSFSAPHSSMRLHDDDAHQSDTGLRRQGPSRLGRNAQTDYYSSDAGASRDIELRELNPFWQSRLGHFGLPSEVPARPGHAVRLPDKEPESSRRRQHLSVVVPPRAPQSGLIPPFPTPQTQKPTPSSRPLALQPIASSDSDEEYMFRRPSAKTAWDFPHAELLPTPSRKALSRLGEDSSASEAEDLRTARTRSRLSRSTNKNSRMDVEVQPPRRPLYRTTTIKSATSKHSPSPDESAYEDVRSDFYSSNAASPSTSSRHLYNITTLLRDPPSPSSQALPKDSISSNAKADVIIAKARFGKDVHTIGSDTPPETDHSHRFQRGILDLSSPPLDRLQQPQGPPLVPPSDLSHYFTTDDGEAVTRKADKGGPAADRQQIFIPPPGTDVAVHGMPHPSLLGKTREEIAKELAPYTPDPSQGPGYRSLVSWDLLLPNDPERLRHEAMLSDFEREYRKHNPADSAAKRQCDCVMHFLRHVPIVDVCFISAIACKAGCEFARHCCVPKYLRNALFDCWDRAGQRAWDKTDPRYRERKQKQSAHLEQLDDLAEAWHEEWLHQYIHHCEAEKQRLDEPDADRHGPRFESSVPTTPVLSEWPRPSRAMLPPRPQSMSHTTDASRKAKHPHAADDAALRPNSPMSSSVNTDTTMRQGPHPGHAASPNSLSKAIRTWADSERSQAEDALAVTPSDSDLGEPSYRSRQRAQQLRRERKGQS